MWGYRVVIPKKLRPQILNELHLTHLGVVKMKPTARSFFSWPGIDNDIEKKARTATNVFKKEITLRHHY